MGKLNQVIAVVSGKKAQAAKVITEVYHKIQKGGLFDGIHRTYRPKDEDGDKLPPEVKAIQVKTNDLLLQAMSAWVDMIDTVATQDNANCKAVADISVNGTKLLGSVPVTHLLFLEKQLNDIATFIGKLPVLDPGETWTYDPVGDHFICESETTRTKKVPKAFVKYEATREHPAQVETFSEDVLVGYWKTVKSSGAIPAKTRNEMLDRVRQLHDAVVKAREEANSIDATPMKVADKLFDFIIGTQ